MTNNKETLPGLEEFDYFSEKPVLSDLKSIEAAADYIDDEGLRERVLLFKKHQRKKKVNLVSMMVFFLFTIYLFYDLQSDLSYVFQHPYPPVELGAAEEISINKLKHNAYVKISGITDHRAASINRLRGMNPKKRVFWYYHFSGSRVFIETPPDMKRFGIQKSMTVTGRVIDIRYDRRFDNFFEYLRKNYLFTVGDNVRLIQVDFKPGEDRWPYVILFALLFIVGNINLYNFYKNHRKAKQIMSVKNV